MASNTTFKLLSFFTFIFAFLISCVWIYEREVHFINPYFRFTFGCRLLLSFRHLGFSKFRNFHGLSLERANLHNQAKFREDRSIRCCNIAIFVVFQDSDRHHLGFWKIQHFNGLSPVGGQFASPCQISSKSVKRLLRYDDLTVFFQKWRPSAILDFGNWKILTVYLSFCVFLPNFAKICPSVVVISRFLWFFKMADAAILVFEKFEILTVCPP